MGAVAGSLVAQSYELLCGKFQMLCASVTRSPVVDEERMSSGHWLVLVHCVPFSALTLMVG